jgi:two-component system nitrogen regulation response regulator NtrX
MAATLLIIDDEESIRDSLSGILGDEGFVTLTAPSAEEGLQLLEQKEIDLPAGYLDARDGRPGGPQGDNPPLRHPVIMISGTPSNRSAGTRMGAFDFIEKPLLRQDILAINRGACRHLERENRILRTRRAAAN